MNRLLLGLAVVAILGTTVALSRTRPDAPAASGTDIRVDAADKNPWTGLKLNNDAEQFQFAVVSDRTGGHRAKIFSRAVHQINLLQPEFVMSVGDLIEGYSKEKEKVVKQWDEFDSYTKKFDMPFFYVPGNHDLTNQMQIELWGGRYGKTYYHFVYKNTLFVAVNSEDGAANTITPAQQEAVKKALDENRGVRWTLVFLHKPLWAQRDLEKNGWLGVEQALAGRNYTVFCGHVHRYQKFIRNGMNYYQLATTGGGSKLRGVRYGEFDHITWITMKKDGPLMANVMLDGILAENLQVPDSDELGVPVKRLPTAKVKGKVVLDGKPLGGVSVVFVMTKPPEGVRGVRADALTEEDGSFTLSTYSRDDGAPAGEYRAAVAFPGTGLFQAPMDGNAKKGEAQKPTLPEKFGRPDTSGLSFEVKAGTNEFIIELMSK